MYSNIHGDDQFNRCNLINNIVMHESLIVRFK